MKECFFRLTLRRTLTLNNRWYKPVHPKHTLFFLPVNKDQIELWIRFLCNSHKKSFLFLHECWLYISNYRYRRLTFYEQQPCYEVLIKDYNLIHVIDKKVLKVWPNQPLNIRYFPVREYLKQEIDDKGNVIPFNPKRARTQANKRLYP